MMNNNERVVYQGLSRLSSFQRQLLLSWARVIALHVIAAGTNDLGSVAEARGMLNEHIVRKVGADFYLPNREQQETGNTTIEEAVKHVDSETLVKIIQEIERSFMGNEHLDLIRRLCQVIRSGPETGRFHQQLEVLADEGERMIKERNL